MINVKKFFMDALYAIPDALLMVGVVIIIDTIFGRTTAIPYLSVFGWCWWGAWIGKGGWIYPKNTN